VAYGSRFAQRYETNGAAPVTPSVDAPFEGLLSTPNGWQKPSPPRALDISEIPLIIEDYRRAAERAKAAGFDGVELHGANGYLPDQFLQDGSNQRTDAYGGSIENRSRFLLEIVEALTSVWGGNRGAVRIGPGGTVTGMHDSNPTALFDYLVEQLNRFGLAYLHIIEPRIKGNTLIAQGQSPVAAEQLRKSLEGKLLLAVVLNPIQPRSLSKKAMRTWSPSDAISSQILIYPSASDWDCR
jgi:N-ethylmaleimide reductase